MLTAAVADFRELSEPWGLTFALLSLGGAMLFRGDAENAVPLIEESVALARAAHNEVFLGNALINLGRARTELADAKEAERALREALTHARSAGSRETAARALDGLAALAAATGDGDRAARLTGAAEGVRRSIGAAVFPTDQAVHARTRAAITDLLGETQTTTLIEGEARRPLEDLLAAPRDLRHPPLSRRTASCPHRCVVT